MVAMYTASTSFSQDSTQIAVANTYIDKLSSTASRLEKKLDHQSAAVLGKLERQEARLRAKLMKIDSVKAKEVFGKIKGKFNNKIAGAKQYIPSLDTMVTSLKFLQKNPQFLSTTKNIQKKLKTVTGKMDGLQDQFQKADAIKTYLNERKKYLKEQLSGFGFAKQLKKINKHVYYYGEQVNEYKSLLKDHKKAEKKAIELLSKTKLFQNFMKRNSMLSSFFPMGTNTTGANTSQSGFAGLQTRAQVNSFLQQAGMQTPNAVSRLQQNVQGAQSLIDQLKNKLTATAGGNDLDMPGFKPNSQRTKSFLKRLEYGVNFQSQKANSFFPTSSDIGLSLGYKLNDRSVLGLGASYKIGWGRGWNNIRVTNEAIGIRSFVDWKIKGSLWLSGGYEQNHQLSFNSIEELKDLNAWQQSGLVGISKVMNLKSKLMKKAKFQLLWDFLSYRQRPRTQQIIFRIGYNF
jgi:hypothetical protein